MCESRCWNCDEPSGPNTTVPWSHRPGLCISCAEAMDRLEMESEDETRDADER
jgi:hypothetical protein